MKYIDSDKLIAEIERMREINKKAFMAEHITADVYHGRTQAINNLFEFIKSLQQEQPSIPFDLDGVASDYAPDFSNDIASKAAVDAIRDAFKAGAQWMVKHGVHIRGRVLPGTHGNSYIESDWFDKEYEGLSWNDEVDLIIQKKQ